MKTNTEIPELDDILPQLDDILPKAPELGVVADVPESAKPKTMIDLYLHGDVRRILEDIRIRPEHYTEEQKTLTQDLYAKRSKATATELNSLFYHYMDQSAVSKSGLEKRAAPEEEEHLFGEEIVGFEI